MRGDIKLNLEGRVGEGNEESPREAAFRASSVGASVNAIVLERALMEARGGEGDGIVANLGSR